METCVTGKDPRVAGGSYKDPVLAAVGRFLCSLQRSRAQTLRPVPLDLA